MCTERIHSNLLSAGGGLVCICNTMQLCLCVCVRMFGREWGGEWTGVGGPILKVVLLEKLCLATVWFVCVCVCVTDAVL